MGLTNSQYEKIQREYSRRIAADREAQQQRIAAAFREIPALKGMEETMADLSLERARMLIQGKREKADYLAARIGDLKEEKAVLLASAGLASDYLELQYMCPHCKDTGYVEGEKCSCMKKMVIDLLYDQSAIRETLRRENFGTFSMEFFDKNVKDTGTGESSYDTMERIVKIARSFVAHFDERHENLLLMGPAGSGKTFLTNCIAKELMDQYHSVIYMSSSQLFETLAKQTFDRDNDPEAMDMSQYLTECDLLIIDDLGTEMNNSFVNARLFNCINERLIRRKSTVISTNLDMNGIMDGYTDRVGSRIMGSYIALTFPDVDVRLLKSLRGYT